MASAKDLMVLTVTSDLDLGWGLTERVTFSPPKVTALVSEAYDLTDNHALGTIICEIVEAWGMTGPVPVMTTGTMLQGSLVKDGEPVPLKPEIVAALPLGLLRGIQQAIVHASIPKSVEEREAAKKKAEKIPQVTLS